MFTKKVHSIQYLYYAISNFLIYNHRTLNNNILLLKYIIHNHRSTRLHVDLPYVTVLITCTYKFRTCC